MQMLYCHNVTMSYEGHPVISCLNFELPEGAYLCVVGENGSGKSTLIRGILGLKAPERGHISFGQGITKSDIGYLPQRTDVQKDFPASVMEVVLSGGLGRMGLRPLYSFADKKRAAECLEKAGAEKLSGKCFMELSGGQQQRVLLARALMAASRMILLDEPVSGLDPAASASFYETVLKLNREQEMTVIMVSHDLRPALRDATFVLSLSESSISAEGDASSEKRDYFFGSVEDYLQTEEGRRMTV